MKHLCVTELWSDPTEWLEPIDQCNLWKLRGRKYGTKNQGK